MTMRVSMKSVVVSLASVTAALAGACASGTGDGSASSSSASAIVIPTNLPPPLASVPVPEPPDLATYVVDKNVAIALGKALFWDAQLGSDGKTACATCHFHAGADSRTRNQLSPGLLRKNPVFEANPDTAVSLGGMNYRLQRQDFPTHRLTNPDDRNSVVLADTNDVVASQGVTYGIFKGLKNNDRHDVVEAGPDPDGFSVGNVNVRRVEPRNTPSIVNAVYNFRQFWDGRAQDEFNGVNSWGDRDPFAFVYQADAAGALTQTRVRIKNASLASQAMAPPLSSFEMSADGRTFAEIGDQIVKDRSSSGKGKKLLRKAGKKLLGLRPLAEQQVAADDSALGAYRKPNGKGLKVSYADLVQLAFAPKWWRADASYVTINPTTGERSVVPRHPGKPDAEEYTLLEYNFSLFFGLAIQLYEATLVSSDTPFDRFLAGNATALTDPQKEGMALFFDTVRVRCVNCHGGSELTDASHTKIKTIPLRRREGNLLDRGFNNIGVRPTLDDIGVGEVDPWGMPLSMARLATLGLFTDPSVSPPVGSNESLGDDGAFKAPGLRNVELTAPYFHNGGSLTLRHVIEFYSRGGDFQPNNNRAGQLISPASTINLTETEKQSLVAFLLGLTDERVRYQRAPFDHPELHVPNGHKGNEVAVNARPNGQPKDRTRVVPAVGAAGGAALPNFLDGPDDDGPDEE